MNLPNQMLFKEDAKAFEQLKLNSYYFKELNRGTIDYKRFVDEMKTLYKERTTDKLNKVIDNMDLISSVLEVLK